ncbi:MAG TPA: hypothetical protein VNX40_12595 [Mucilaginibacter sp.]|nr:hypothetical protein [Mucilaginibacter sp.]
MKPTLFIFLVFIISFSHGNGQGITNSKFQLPEYCRADSAKSKTLIGRRVKIWHDGGIYATLNTDSNFVWPSAEAKRRGGENGWGNFKPKTGDTGVVVHIFIYEGDRQKYVYLLKIKENYVPIGCFYVTDLDKPDAAHYSTWDSLKNIDYAKGCKFKRSNINNNWSGAGNTAIDSISETFACDLTSTGIDTVMLCKGYSGVSSTSTAFVLWEGKGKGYVKAFFIEKGHRLAEHPIKFFPLKPVLSYFFNNKLDTITREFKPKMQAEMPDLGGLSIQLYAQNLFFRQFIPELLVKAYHKEPEAIWWKMVTDQLLAIKKE